MIYKIITPARLHFGLINLSGFLDRCDGGFGVSISSPSWDIDIQLSDSFLISGKSIAKEHLSVIQSLLNRFSPYIGNGSVHIHFNSIISPHCGLGSKTSLLLSISKLMVELFELKWTMLEIQQFINRGGTSGVGINLFDEGGFIVDIGHSYDDKHEFLPSSLSELPFPKRMLSVKNSFFKIIFFRFSENKIFGQIEKKLFQDNCPLSDEDTKSIVCHLFFQIIPAFLENDNTLLQKGLKTIQTKGFKKIEWENQGEIEKDFVKFWYKRHEDSALCLSSCGPGLFYIGTEIEKVLATINSYQYKPVDIFISKINNSGAEVYKL